MSSKALLFLILISPFIQLNIESKKDLNQSVNAIIGDVSFVDSFNRAPLTSDSELLRITTHLEYVANLLKQADVSHLSNEQLENRLELIHFLEKYTREGQFPKNYDFQDQRRPTFIDKDGNICAVGYLVQQTVGQHAAEAINATYKYEYVSEMESGLLESWLIEHGLSKKEAAMIQPAYGPIFAGEKNIESKEVGVEYGVSSALLVGGQVFMTSLVSNSNTLTYKEKTTLSLINSGFGVASILTGIKGLNDSERTYYQTETQAFNNQLYLVNETNDLLKGVSIANIVFGSASVLFNGYQVAKSRKNHKQEAISVASSVEYLPGVSEPVPTLNLSLSF